MTFEFQPSRSARRRLIAARSLTDDLFRLVREPSLYDRPIAERHRVIFYVGHLEAFDANLFRATLGDLPTADPTLDRLFAFGIDPLTGSLPSDEPRDWPRPDAVRRYVEETRSLADRFLSAADKSGQPDFVRVLNVAIEHRLMHAETLAYMLHRLPYSAKVDRPEEPAEEFAHRPGRVPIPAGRATLGNDAGFGWDNEFPTQGVDLPAFAIDRHKVTNGEFLAFVEAGGYSAREFWTPDDWDWRCAAAISHPAFWVRHGDRWFWRGMFAERPLPPSWPVYVSHAEASAYARWRGATLPSEAQFHRAAYGAPGGEERPYPWGAAAPAARHGNFDFARWEPSSVSAHAAGDSAFGISGLVGNGWEWTATAFAPFDGFQPLPFYRGYSADFFDGRHYVLKGGSMRTAAPLLRRSFRNWFQPHYPYIYAGFRCAYGA